MNKALKIVLITLGVYVLIVVLFETLLGVFQPQGEDTIVITTFDNQGEARDRVVSRLEHEGEMYVAVNHWPRAWYRRVLDNPQIQVTYNGNTDDYLAVRLEGAEHQEKAELFRIGFVGRLLMGFPPRHFLRLDPL